MNLAPIYIPSKGRAGRASAIELFCRLGIRPIVFVEPHEVRIYRDVYPDATVVDIGAVNQGMAFVRNFMLAYAVGHAKMRWCWQIDDDIQSFHYRANWEVQRVIRVHEEKILTRLDEAQDVLTFCDPAYSCLQWRNTAWCASKPTTWNRKCGLVTLLDVSVMKRYQFRGVLRSDIDMSLQLLADGHKTATYNRLSFAAPGCGLNRVGGLSKQYDLGSTEHKAVKAFVDRWQPWASLRTTSSGRPDVKIDWHTFLKDHKHPDAQT